jgi:hypothetical protein
MWATTRTDDAGCPACASGWHTRCRWPDHTDDDDGELVEPAVTGC